MTRQPVVTWVHVDHTVRDRRFTTTPISAADDPEALTIGALVGLLDDKGNSDAGIVTAITQDGVMTIRILSVGGPSAWQQGVTEVHVNFDDRVGRCITVPISAADDPGVITIGALVGLWDDKDDHDAGIVTAITQDGVMTIRTAPIRDMALRPPSVTWVHVDFTDRDGRRITTPISAADDPEVLTIGAQVNLWDDKGDLDKGIVTAITQDGVMTIRILRGKWRSHEHIEALRKTTPTRRRLGFLVLLLGLAIIGFGFYNADRANHISPFQDWYIRSGFILLLVATGLFGLPENNPERPPGRNRNQPPTNLDRG